MRSKTSDAQKKEDTDFCLRDRKSVSFFQSKTMYFLPSPADVQLQNPDNFPALHTFLYHSRQIRHNMYLFLSFGTLHTILYFWIVYLLSAFSTLRLMCVSLYPAIPISLTAKSMRLKTP